MYLSACCALDIQAIKKLKTKKNIFIIVE